jgi:hypothetical protein
LEQIDALLRQSGVEQDFVQRALAGWMWTAARTLTKTAGLKFYRVSATKTGR